jgi:hypothetical protein
MVPSDEPDGGARAVPSDDPQRLLVIAYARLSLSPERPDGSRLATIASFGALSVRVVELPVETDTPTPFPIWVELYDLAAGQLIDSAGCRDLREAGVATEAFIAEAQRRNGQGAIAP